MIDLVTGEVRIQNQGMVLGPKLTRDRFLAHPSFQALHCETDNWPSGLYRLRIPAGNLMPLRSIAVVGFAGQVLEVISLSVDDVRFGETWSDWSESKELDRKQYHDKWLAEVVGYHGEEVAWGGLESGYDPRSGGSDVVLRYSVDGKPWKPKR